MPVISRPSGKASIAQSEPRPPRKYYELTRAGREVLADAVKRYRLLEQTQPQRKREPSRRAPEDAGGVRPHLRLIALIGLIVPRRLRADWRQEWEPSCATANGCSPTGIGSTGATGSTCCGAARARWDALWLQNSDWRLTCFRTCDTACGCCAPSRLHGGRRRDAGARHRRQHRHLQLLDTLLIRTLPVEQPHQLVAFVSDASGEPGISPTGLRQPARSNDVLSGLVAFVQRPFTVTDGTMTERLTGEIVSGNYFDVLGVGPALGRFFLPEEDARPACTRWS